jgi:hypothetical protein
MVYKHLKFDESATMRSFERLAQAKGLIKNEIVKKAEVKLDLTPTNNLMENIIKLCEGLNAFGLNKYANELEQAFILYKKAETECDKDIIDQAHPKGSHQLEGFNSELSIIETIIDQHLKILKMINKVPSGKLNTKANIINAVKRSFEKKADVEEDSNTIIRNIEPCLNIYISLKDVFNENTDVPISSKIDLYNIIHKVNIVIKQLQQLKSKVSSMSSQDVLEIIHNMTMVNSEIYRIFPYFWNILKDNLNFSITTMNSVRDIYVKNEKDIQIKKDTIRSEEMDKRTKNIELSKKLKNLFDSFDYIKDKFTHLKYVIEHDNKYFVSEQKQSVYDWIDGYIKAIEEQISLYANNIIDDNQIIQGFNSLNAIVNSYNEFLQSNNVIISLL